MEENWGGGNIIIKDIREFSSTEERKSLDSKDPLNKYKKTNSEENFFQL